MLHSFDYQYLNHRTVSLPVVEPTDEDLMSRIQEGDEAALETLHQRHHALMRTIISRMINNDQDVDDLVQECLLEIWRRAAAYRVEKGHALGWIVTLVRRRTIDRIRRKMAYSRAQDRFREQTTHASDGVHSGADEEVAQSDRGEAVSRMIADLPVAQQEAVRLAYYRGMSQRQIAAHTGIPLGTVKTRLELALRKLRSAVLAFGELHDPLHPAHA
jgi:RNA polymerase sigma-70 factor (ECF subfamily)